MTLIDFVTQFWVFLLSVAVMVAMLVAAVGVRAAWKERQERPMEIDQTLREKLDRRLSEISTPRRKTA